MQAGPDLQTLKGWTAHFAARVTLSLAQVPSMPIRAHCDCSSLSLLFLSDILCILACDILQMHVSAEAPCTGIVAHMFSKLSPVLSTVVVHQHSLFFELYCVAFDDGP